MGPKQSRWTVFARGERAESGWLSGWNFMNWNELELDANNNDDDDNAVVANVAFIANSG